MQQEKLHIQHLIAGDLEAFRCVYDRHYSKVYGYCLNLVKNQEVAEEITSDVFMKLWQKREQLVEEGSLQNLLFLFTKGLCIDYLRRMSRREQSRKAFWQDYQLYHESKAGEDLKQEQLQVLKEAIQTLPPRRRKVFELRYEEEMSYQQIAQRLGVSPNTVKVQLSKATKHLREQVALQYGSSLTMILLSQHYLL